MKTFLIVSGLIIGAMNAVGSEEFPDLEACYQRHGQIEETAKNGKKITTYKDAAQVAAGCNEDVVKRAKSEKSEGTIMVLAGVIGRHSNWASAVPVYTVAAQKFPKVCTHEDTLYSLEDALARPADDKIAKNALTLMSTCWPAAKEKYTAFLKEGQNGYVKQHVCGFLKGKSAIPANKKDICEG